MTTAPSDRPPSPEGQDGAGPWDFVTGRGRLRLSTLAALRWRGVLGQALVLAVAGLAFQAPAPWPILIPLVLITAASNIALSAYDTAKRQATDAEIAAVLSFDMVGLAAILFFSGGVLNPFSVLLVAPMALAAATVNGRYVIGMVTLGFVLVAAMAVWGWALPLPEGQTVIVSDPFKAALTIALQAAIAFTASYAWRASAEAERMELALNATRTVLAREQQLSALGALAAAAAHELGTPLATIQIVAKELGREIADPRIREDAELLVSQAERCREILKRLTDAPLAEDAMHARLSLREFLNEVIEPHLSGPIRVEAVVTGPPGEAAPEIRRMPEVLHAMTTFVENATDFAKGEILISARFDQRHITVEVRDDGPGFAPEILSKLGQPYVTSRPSGEGSRSGHTGMGLGFFIAKTLLEKTGALVSFENGKRGGAVVSAQWLRESIEAPVLRDFYAPGVEA